MAGVQIIGYKAFNKDLTCRDFKYKMGQTYDLPKTDIKVCRNGFHFCKFPLDTWGYYPDIINNRYAKIEAKDRVETEGNKSSTNNITILKELTLDELVRDQINLINATIGGDNNQLASSGYNSKLASSGDNSKLASSGYSDQLASSGYNSQLASSGDNSKLASSGDNSKLASSGDDSKLASSGDNSKLASSGYNSKLELSGINSIGANIGLKGRVKGFQNNWIVLVEYDNNGVIKEIYRAKIGKHKIKGQLIQANTWYWIENGELKREVSNG